MSFTHRIEEGILFFIIFINILGFFDLLPGDIKVIKICLSWIVLSYLIYQADLGRVIFGKTEHLFTLGILLGCFFLLFKQIVQFAIESHATSDIFQEALAWIYILNLDYALTYHSFIIGIGIFLVVAIVSALLIPVEKNSLLSLLHQMGRSHHPILRITLVYLILLFFYITVFNFAFEWLGEIIETPLVLLVIFSYLIFVIRHHKRFSIEHLIFKAGNAGSSFYERYLGFFSRKETFLLGISGILVLHLIADAAAYLIPYLTGLGSLPHIAESTAFFSLFLADTAGQHAIRIAGLIFIYTANIITLLALFFAPALIWYEVYKRKGFLLKKKTLLIFLSALAATITLPLFRLSSIDTSGLAGTVLSIHGAATRNLLLPIIAAAIMLILFYLTHKKRLWIAASIMSVCIFFFYYIVLFSKSVIRSYVDSIIILSGGSILSVASAIVLAIFLSITALFYSGGFIIFIVETIKEYKRIK